MAEFGENLEDELEESFEYGVTYDFSNLIDIDNGSFYDQFESVLQYAYNNFLVPWGNTKIKEWIYDLAQAEYDESQKIYRYEYDADGNQVFNEDGTPTARTGKILAATPMGRFGESEELEGGLLFLLNNEAAGFITGVVLPIDGGFSAYSGV